MNRYIYEKLKEYKNKKIYPLYMPGHKRNEIFLKDFYEFIDLDFTELDETDNMHKPTDVIKKCKISISNTFKCNDSYFLVNGSSCGIIASILACVETNEEILVAKNCHISIYNGLALSGALPIYIEPKIKYNLPCGIDVKDIEKAIKKYPNIKACILTSPTYEGFVSDIENIRNLLHKNNIILIVDEAHGAHFNFSHNFPKTAIECGADISIQSFHKTMPSFTQCGVLHFNSNLVNKKKLEQCLSIMQTTSPSYMFMLSIEYANYFCVKNKELFNDYTLFLKDLREDLKNLEKIKLIDSDVLKDSSIIDFDISRLTFLINSDVSGRYINNILKENKFQLEMYGNKHIIAISTICDNFNKLLELKDILFKIDKQLVYKKQNFIEKKENLITIPKVLPKDAFYKDKILKNINYCENKINANFITPYPPGIPILTPGDIITKEIINKINIYIKNNINILGINDKKEIEILLD